MIAVMGAAGHVGGQVARLLLARGQDVRALEHRTKLDGLRALGAAVISGDAADPETLRRLFAGAHSALVMLPDILSEPDVVATRSRISRAIRDALSAERVGHVVMLSSVGVERTDVAGPPAGLRELEGLLAQVPGLNVLMLRSTFYMDYLLANLPLIEAQGINGSAIDGDRAFPMVATLDVAVEAADRLVKRDFTGAQTQLLLGPAELSMRSATRALGARLGKPELPYVQFPPDGMRHALAGAGMSQEGASLLVDLQLWISAGGPFQNVEGARSVRTRTTLDAFLADAIAQPAV
jgi:uncharacterized protein YbjT (DUF2867 family)